MQIQTQIQIQMHREFLGQAWMKEDKKKLAPNISLITERFNDVGVIIIFDIVIVVIIVVDVVMIIITERFNDVSVIVIFDVVIVDIVIVIIIIIIIIFTKRFNDVTNKGNFPLWEFSIHCFFLINMITIIIIRRFG